MKTTLLYAAIAVAITPVIKAADITWQSPTTISGTSDVSLDGTFAGSWAPGDDYGSPNRSDDHPVNGVTFAAYGSGLFSAGFSNTGVQDRYNGFGNAGTADSDYNYLLTVAGYSYGVPITLTLTGLTVGNTYELEFWANDGRGNDRTQTFTGGVNTSAALNVAPSSGGPGQFIIGTFVADGSGSQTISIDSGDAGSYGPLLNLAQIRDISPVPEPSTVAILSGGFGVLIWGLRRKNRQV